MKKIIRAHFDIIIALLTVFLVVFLDRITKVFFFGIFVFGRILPCYPQFFSHDIGAQYRHRFWSF